MFKMLLFLVALEPLLMVFYLSLLNISSGKIAEGLPFAAISIMTLSYFARGASETISYVKSLMK